MALCLFGSCFKRSTTKRVGLGTITVFDLYKKMDLNVHNVLIKFAGNTKICSRICNGDDVQKL